VGPHFAQDPALDRAVGGDLIRPPPTVPPHRVACRDETASHGIEIGIGEVQAEDQAPGSYPAEREALGTKIVLQHPVVA
jgi:hypothetical protein